MLNLKKLKKSKFSLVESVRTYKDMAIELFVPVIKTSLLAMIFILLGQTALSFVEHNSAMDICFWIWTLFVVIVAVASIFKTSEDIILSKKPKIYDSVAHILLLSAKLFAVIAIIAGVAGLLITPIFFLENPLFALPYKFLVTIFLVAVVPFIYFAPLAVVLREANILNSFVFSYYMVLARWGKVAKAIVVQIIFTAIIAFWVYLLIAIIFFPHSFDFFNFLLTKATALELQTRSLYIPFVIWEISQVFALILVAAIFTGANTILFMHLEGTLFKLVKEKIKFIVNPMKAKSDNARFIDVLAGGKSVEIDTSSKKHNEVAEKYDYDPDDFDDGYSEYQEQDNFSMTDDIDSTTKDEDVEILEDEETQGQQEETENAEGQETAPQNEQEISEKETSSQDDQKTSEKETSEEENSQENPEDEK